MNETLGNLGAAGAAVTVVGGGLFDHLTGLELIVLTAAAPDIDGGVDG